MKIRRCDIRPVRIGGRLRWLALALLLPIALLVALAGVTLSANATPAAEADVTVVTVENRIVQRDVKRFGINLGSHKIYDASLLLHNIIPNPGFEAGEMAMLFVVRPGPLPTSTQTLTNTTQYRQRVQAANWRSAYGLGELQTKGQPDQFWTGAAYEIVTGVAAGTTGTVAAFATEGDFYTFYLTSTAAIGPAAGDAVAVRMVLPGVQAGCCGRPGHVADPTERRPGSPGTQSLRLLPPDAAGEWYAYRFYADSFGRDADATASQLLIADGRWRLSFWAKAANPADTLTVVVRRAAEGQARFFTETIPLSTTWRLVSRTIVISPGADRIVSGTRHAPFGVEMSLKSTSDDVWIDDIFFGRADHANPTTFSDVVVDALGRLQPGILRNWGRQLGSSLANELAPAAARRTTGWRPVHTTAAAYHYPLHDFLALADHIGAEPWYVIPPTFSAAEMAGLAAYLGAPLESGDPLALLRAQQGQIAPWTTRFATIHLEFGNELWGSNYEDDPFWGATVHGGLNAAQLAGARFGALQASPWYDPARYNLVIGGQAFYTPTNATIDATSTAHSALALAPYFGRTFSADSTTADLVYSLFANPTYDVVSGKVGQTAGLLADDSELAIYELNFHSTRGTLDIDLRNGYVSGLAGGLALPLHMLTYLRDFGAVNQAAFELAQYSTPVEQASAPPPALVARDLERRLSAGIAAPVERAPDAVEFTRLWGVLRDLEATGRPRPTYLGVQLANRALHGSLVTTVQQGANPQLLQMPVNDITVPTVLPLIQSFAFREGSHYALLLFNLHLTQTAAIRLALPDPVDGPAVRTELRAAGIFSSNETLHEVRLISSTWPLTQAGGLTLPPHSLTLLTWDGRVPLAVTHATAQLAAGPPPPPRVTNIVTVIAGLLLLLILPVWRLRRR